MSDDPSGQSDRLEQCFDFVATRAFPSILEIPFFGRQILLAPYTLTAVKTTDDIL